MGSFNSNRTSANQVPNRVLREGIITSLAVNTLSWAAEVFYRRLHSVVDDFGRYHAHPSLLRAACYPLLLNKVTDADIVKWRTEACTAGLVSVYAVDGREYLQVTKFDQRVRAEKSKFPHPPPDDGQLTVTCQTAAPVVVVEDVVEDVVVKPDSSEPARKPRRSKPAVRWNGAMVCMLPVVGNDGADVAITSEFVEEMQRAYPQVDCVSTLAEIRAWCLANPTRRKTATGVHRFVQSWFAREQNRG